MSTKPRRADTKSMGLARLRNRLEEKSLDRRLEVLSSDCRGRCNKLRTEIGLLEDSLRLMSPVVGKPVICPKGLTEKEKAQYRELRRNSYNPSMSLQEFDVRLTDYRHLMLTYRRKSLHSNPEDTVFEDAGIIDLDEHQFCAPITKHKHTMKEALKRATTTTPKATTVSPQYLPKSTRSHSEGSVATQINLRSDTSANPSSSAKIFHRSISHPHPKHSAQEVATTSAVATSVSGTWRISGRPLTACSSSPSTGVSFRPQRAETPGPRCRSASASRPGTGRQEIWICPDYVAARRMSVDTVYSEASKTPVHRG